MPRPGASAAGERRGGACAREAASAAWTWGAGVRAGAGAGLACAGNPILPAPGAGPGGAVLAAAIAAST
jgi:hypothetical protein